MAVYMITQDQMSVIPDAVKIGCADNPLRRLNELQVAHWVPLRIMRLFRGSFREEGLLHRKFQHLHINREWFRFSRGMLGDIGLVEITTVAGSIEPVEPTAPAVSPSTSAGGFGDRIRELRQSRGLTQFDLAVAVAVSRSSIASIERGFDMPGRKMLLALAAFFGTDFTLAEIVQKTEAA